MQWQRRLAIEVVIQKTYSSWFRRVDAWPRVFETWFRYSIEHTIKTWLKPSWVTGQHPRRRKPVSTTIKHCGWRYLRLSKNNDTTLSVDLFILIPESSMNWFRADVWIITSYSVYGERKGEAHLRSRSLQHS